MFLRLSISISPEDFLCFYIIEFSNHLLFYSPEVKTIYVIRGQEKKEKSVNNIQQDIVIKQFHKEEM